MGVDARMFVRIKGKERHLRPEQVLPLSVRLAATLGSENFMITKGSEHSYGRPHHALSIVGPIETADDADWYGLDLEKYRGKVVWTQDGPDIVAGPDEQFVQVHLSGRYYGPGYERGHWPTYDCVARWLGLNMPPGSETWYGGDSSGICAEHVTDPFLSRMMALYLNTGNISYQAAFFSPGRNPRVICPCCETPMVSAGGGQGKTFWSCLSCERIAVSGDGRQSEIKGQLVAQRWQLRTGPHAMFSLSEAFEKGQRGVYVEPKDPPKEKTS